MTVSLDIQCHVGFGSVNGSCGFTEAKPLFSFDNWIVLRVSHELLLLQVKQLKTATAKMNCLRPYRLTTQYDESSMDRTSVDYGVSASLELYCLQCFDAVGWAAGRASGL